MASLDGVEILILVICCIFAFKLIGNTNALADKFSKGSGMNIASKLGGLASGAVVASAATGASIGAKFGGAVLEETGIAGKFTDAGNSVKNFFLNGASSVGKAVGLGRFQPQNQPTATAGTTATVQNGNPAASTSETGSRGTTNAKQPAVERNDQGFVTLPNGQEVNGLGEATRNDDGGVTFTSLGADGSKNIDSYDKNGNRTVQTFNSSGEMTSSYTQNTDGSSSGFIQREDGTTDRWNDPAGTFKNVGSIQERNKPETEKST